MKHIKIRVPIRTLSRMYEMKIEANKVKWEFDNGVTHNRITQIFQSKRIESGA